MILYIAQLGTSGGFMKYSLKNITISTELPNKSGKATFGVDAIDVEFNVEEMAQGAANAVSVVNCIKDAIKELVPMISEEIEKHEEAGLKRAIRRDEEREKFAAKIAASMK